MSLSVTFRSAGYWMAHAAWSVEDGEVLIPLLTYVSRDGQRRAARIDFEDYQESVDYGLEKLEANEGDDASACFIFDGYTPRDMGRQDALVAQIKDYREPGFELTVLVVYDRPTEGSLRIVKEKVLSTTDFDQTKLESCMQAFYEGIAEHTEGERIWRGSLQ